MILRCSSSPPFQHSHSPTSLYNDCKGSEADGPHKESQTLPIPGRLADQDLSQEEAQVSTQTMGRPDTVLFVCGLRIPPRFSPCKTHSREMAHSRWTASFFGQTPFQLTYSGGKTLQT